MPPYRSHTDNSASVHPSSDPVTHPPIKTPVPTGQVARPRARVLQVPYPAHMTVIASPADTSVAEQYNILENELKEALEEIACLKAQEEKDELAYTLVKNEVLIVRDEALQCVVCTQVCSHPFTTSCGHSFCYDCLKGWFQSIIAMAARDIRGVPLRLQEPPYTDADLLWLYNKFPDFSPEFSCPICRGIVKERPSPSVALIDLMEGVEKLFGGVRENAGTPHSCAASDLWKGVFVSKLRPATPRLSIMIELSDDKDDSDEDDIEFV
ncbi:hypothetical protein BJ138DRAFT_1236464 [Hygrophoropsis aurantiaca]|uniref:Uncharacterized protein n=1 Tax=Hygrophoropsis aurantiaca TaxID=72124 RepID=A0ACB7ZV79_9AGAM|nr:hypothetical protein BJ138DRAFT_1236464 [Hygrophoropsis aurantiaca]